MFIASLSPILQTKLNFQVENEWNLLPDGEGALHMIHANDMFIDDAEPRFEAETDVVFILFTQNNPTSGQIIPLNDAAGLANSNFNAANPTRFIVHGWNNDGNSAVNVIIRQGYMDTHREFNVIVVDWGLGANTINYLAARNRVGPVGAVIARFIEFLGTSGLSRGQTSIVGHSLGAHIAGMAGKSLTGEAINTIVGLDPAGPLFNIHNRLERLDVTDARYVESIITNGGTLGMMEPMAGANFYPNGGQTQPGCGIDVVGNCAHGRAVAFFAESITSTRGFWSDPCHFEELRDGLCTRDGVRARMGGEPSNFGINVAGVYHGETGRFSPFACTSIICL